MKIRKLRIQASVVLIVVGSLLLTGCVSSVGGQPQRQTGAATATAAVGGASNHAIIIPNNDMFAPYVAVLNVGDSVTWLNQDTVLHTILTTPAAQGEAVNPEQFQFVLGAGKSASITLRQPGVYYYYCDAHASLPDSGPAAARSGVRAYPMPMDGFLYVLGPSISGAPSQTVNMSTENRFTPWITIVNPGGVVTWANKTQRTINLQGVPGYGLVNPSSLSVKVAPGGSSSITFKTVGIYVYYATEYAKLDPVWLRPEAISGAAGYPVPMEGIVAVFP